MKPTRLEAFSDGVLAIVITIMVLELKVPHASSEHAATPADLAPLVPTFLSYLLSFVYIGIYWNNHHHLMHACARVSGGVLWANLHLLFWLSLFPFTTHWVGETHFSPWAVSVYGVVLLMAGLAWEILRRALIRVHDRGSVLERATARGKKEPASVALYAAGVALPFAGSWGAWASLAVYALVACIWLIPDRRIERALAGVLDH